MRVSVRRRSVLSLICITVVLTSLTFRADAQTTTSSSFVYLPLLISSGTEYQVVALMNEQRHLNGCNIELAISAQLSTAAFRHSRDMAVNDYFSHDGSDQSTMETRAKDAGYSYSLLAENLQAGASSPQELVNDPNMGWMQSPGHRANILNCGLREIGLGYYYQADDRAIPGVGGPFRHYWTADFGTPLP